MKHSLPMLTGRAIVQGAVEVLLFAQLLMLLGFYSLPEPLAWIWLISLPLLYGIGCLASQVLRLNRFYKLFLFTAAAGGGYSYALFSDDILAWVISAFVSLFVLYRGGRMSTGSWRDQFPVVCYLTGVILYFLVSFIMQFQDGFSAYQPALTACGVLAFAVTLYAYNETNIKQETLSGDKEPVISKSVLWQNRIFVFLLFAAAVLFTLFRYVQQAFLWLKQLIVDLLNQLPTGQTEPPEAEPPPDPMKAPMMPEESSEPSAFMVLLERIAFILVYVLIGLLILYLLYQGVRRLVPLVKLLYQRLTAWINRGDNQDAGKGYVDDIESLVKLKSEPGKWRDRFKERWDDLTSRSPRWTEEMSNEEKIRFLYRVWLSESMKEGYERKPHLTPLETLADLEQWRNRGHAAGGPITTLYEKVRYGNQPIDDKLVEEIKQLIDRK